MCLPPIVATLALLERWLGEEATPDSAVRFQQLSAPLAAKAVEDTAYYRYGVLLSRNEVGADVRRFSASVAEFHAACLARRKHFPDAMLATATHDHKRGEDVRARLAVLSEIPDEWERAVRRWLRAEHAASAAWRCADAFAGRRGDAVPDDRRCLAHRSARSAGLHGAAGRLAAQGAARGEAGDGLDGAEPGVRGRGAVVPLHDHGG